MKSKKIILSIIFAIFFVVNSFGVSDPKGPNTPQVSNDDRNNSNKTGINVIATREGGKQTKGTITEWNNFYITGLTWFGNEDGKQSLQINYIKSIEIKGYTMQKSTKDNLSVVFYFPYLYDITLKNGKIITDAMGKIKEINTFNAKTVYGNQKCYTYFVRYWLEDKGEFANNGSKDYNEKPVVPEETVILLDFSENN